MLKLQTFAAISLFGFRKILHPLVGMDIAAFVTAVVLPGKVTKISHYSSKATQIFHKGLIKSVFSLKKKKRKRKK